MAFRRKRAEDVYKRQLLNEIAEGAGADLGIADLNGDGEISMADVELLLSRIQEQE